MLLAGWEGASRAGLIPANVLPAPSAVGEAFWKLLLSGELIENIRISTLRALSGFVIGGSIGFALGLANGLSALSRELTDTTLQMIRNIPHLALIPLVILWFGIDEEAKLFLVALGVFFPIYVNTLLGIQGVDPQLVEMGRIYGMSRRELFLRVILPGALPSIFVGLALCAGYHVADIDRRRNHLRVLGPWLHGDAGARVPAHRRRCSVDIDLCAAWKAGGFAGAVSRADFPAMAPCLPDRLRNQDDRSDHNSPQILLPPLHRASSIRRQPQGKVSLSPFATWPSSLAARPCCKASTSMFTRDSSLRLSARAVAARVRLLRLLAGLDKPTSGELVQGPGTDDQQTHAHHVSGAAASALGACRAPMSRLA